MMFHKESKICFSLVPRTGSTSLRNLLINLKMRELVFNSPLSFHHTKYKDAVKVYPNLSKYTIYGVFRNPAERLVSALNFTSPVQPLHLSSFIKNGTVLIDEIKNGVKNNQQHILYHPQRDWFEEIPNPKVISFDNLQAGLDTALATFDGYKTIQHLHKSPAKHVQLTPELEEFAREHYAADYQFAKDVLGKEY